MAKKRQKDFRFSSKLDEQRTLRVDGSRDWLTIKILHAQAGVVSVPVDLFLKGDRQEAANLAQNSRRIVAYGNVAECLKAAFDKATHAAIVKAINAEE